MRANRRTMQIGAAVVVLSTVAHIAGAADAGAMPSAETARRLIVSIPDRRLALVENDRVVRMYRIAVGAPSSPSPTGTFTIVSRVSNPTYYRPGKVIGPGASNPIGTRWIGLNQKGYGIHGTDEPNSIGHAASHGCVRLRNEDIAYLYSIVPVGTPVYIY